VWIWVFFSLQCVCKADLSILFQEGPLRPVLECIDLLSDGEDEGGVSAADTVSFFIRRLEYKT